MPDILNTAVSGMLAYQRSLATTSHNIANVNNEGYSRQRVELDTNIPGFNGSSYYGSGVKVESVGRVYDQFLATEVRDTSSAYSQLAKFGELASQIDDMLADPQNGIGAIAQEFFSAIQTVADDPASITARISMMETAEALAGRYASVDHRLEELSLNTGADLRNVVDEINQIVAAIRDVNLDLSNLSVAGAGTQQSADLLDRRDRLLSDLSEKVDISVINEQENHLTIFLGNGQTVLSDTTAFTLSVQSSPADPERDVISYNGLIQVFDISARLSGGELGGLLDFRDQVLQPTRNALGRGVIGLAETLNQQMRDGMDLNGNLGQDFFSYDGPRSFAHTANTGTATVTTVVSDVTALTTDNYALSYDGTDWTLTSDSGNSTTVANGAPATLVFEGLTLTIDGATAVAGDRFTLKPTRFGAGSLAIVSNDARDIAAAAPIRTLTSLANLGDVAIGPGSVTDVTDANLLTTVTLTFDDPPTSFQADADVQVGGVAYLAGSTIPYNSGMLVDANGWQASLDGTPQAGDQLLVESNAGGVGDNRNALALANLQNLAVFDGANTSFQQDYANLVGQVGSRTQSASFERDAQEILQTQAISRRDSKVSVNLDEEAADMVRFQQAYEASARIVGVAQTIFNTLIQSLR